MTGFFKFHNLNPIYKTFISRIHTHTNKKFHTIYPNNRIIQALGSSPVNEHNPLILFDSTTYKISKRWHVGHSHRHRDQSSIEAESIFRLGLAADIGLAVGKSLTGYLSGSTAIIADAAHSVSDVSEHKKDAAIIDGKAIAQTIRSEIASEVRHLSEKYGKVPGLSVVIVGMRKDSQSYVSMKRKACAEVGIKSYDVDLPEQVPEAELISKVRELNAHPGVHGILVQLPLPTHINEEKVLSEITVEKDVDGFHPLNIGRLAMKGREPLFVPCTPKATHLVLELRGCLELLSRSGISIKGKKAVVIGRSNIVGLPVSLLLLKADATITVVHSHTRDPESIVREADIIIAAAGQAMMVKGSWIKPGAAVIDVGTNAIDDPSKKAGYRLVGDVDYKEACKVAGWITPVPGGVGPMTVAMLLQNTLEGAKRVIEQ